MGTVNYIMTLGKVVEMLCSSQLEVDSTSSATDPVQIKLVVENTYSRILLFRRRMNGFELFKSTCTHPVHYWPKNLIHDTCTAYSKPPNAFAETTSAFHSTDD